MLRCPRASEWRVVPTGGGAGRAGNTPFWFCLQLCGHVRHHANQVRRCCWVFGYQLPGAAPVRPQTAAEGTKRQPTMHGQGADGGD